MNVFELKSFFHELNPFIVSSDFGIRTLSEIKELKVGSLLVRFNGFDMKNSFVSLFLNGASVCTISIL